MENRAVEKRGAVCQDEVEEKSSGGVAYAPIIEEAREENKVDKPATKKELFSYYAYYAGNNGIGSFQ